MLKDKKVDFLKIDTDQFMEIHHSKSMKFIQTFDSDAQLY